MGRSVAIVLGTLAMTGSSAPPKLDAARAAADRSIAVLWQRDVRPDGSDLRQLTSFDSSALPSGEGGRLARPAWSPDGGTIILTGGLIDAGNPYSADLWLLQLADGPAVIGARALRAAAAVGEWHPSWSPGGDRVLFGTMIRANCQNRSQLIARRLNTGTEIIMVDQTKQLATRPEWNPVEPVPLP